MGVWVMTVAPFDYPGMRDTGDELIEEFGQTVAIRRTVDSGTEWDPTQTTTDYATKGAKVEFTWSQRQDSSVLVTDERWLVSAGPLDDLVLTPVDKIVVGGVALEIIKASPVNPGGVAVVFDCQVRA